MLTPGPGTLLVLAALGSRSISGAANRLKLDISQPCGEPSLLIPVCSHSTYSRKSPFSPKPTEPVVSMSAIGPLSIGAPVTGSWKVEPAGSMMWAPNRPWPHECSPSTWSWKKTVPSSTSLYQRYCTNSTPVFSPDAWAFCRGVASCSMWSLIEAILVTTSVSGLPWPTSMLIPGRSPAVLATDSVVAPAGAAAVSVVSPDTPVSGATDCSKDRPVITPSEACGSNCTKWVWMLILLNRLTKESVGSDPSVLVSSFVSVKATQSPTSDLMATGVGAMVPALVAATCWLRTKISPLGSVRAGIGFPLPSTP